MTNVASGVTGASPIWRKIFNEAVTDGRSIPGWVVPPGVEAVRTDAISGYPSHDSFTESAEYVIPSTFPSLPDPIHSKIKVGKSDGKLATEEDIQRGSYDEPEFRPLKETDPTSTDGKNRWQDGIEQWISSLPADQQSRYRPPTDLCSGSKDEVWINMSGPQDRTDYPSTSIEVKVTTATEGEMDRVEIWVNGVLKETLKSSPYITTLSLPTDRYTIFARGIRKDGKQGQTGDARIGTGGMHWEAPPPSPTPSPTPSPSPTPTPSPGP